MWEVFWEVLCGRCSGRYYGRGVLGGGTVGEEWEGSQVGFFVGSPEQGCGPAGRQSVAPFFKN